nr:hypothetical protein [Kibdelosporangium sp. MJ126-NF4]
MLLHAQPVSRIVRLPIDDIIEDADQVLIRLGDPPSPVPQAFAALLPDYTASRTTMSTAPPAITHSRPRRIRAECPR